jgi:hypothetical protein
MRRNNPVAGRFAEGVATAVCVPQTKRRNAIEAVPAGIAPPLTGAVFLLSQVLKACAEQHCSNYSVSVRGTRGIVYRLQGRSFRRSEQISVRRDAAACEARGNGAG